MNPRRKKRLTIISSILAGVAIVAGLSLYALSTNIDLFFTPSEIVNGKDDTGEKPVVGQRIRVGGLVVAGTVNRDSESLKVQFKLIDTGPMITVKYDGILPDLFREGQGIVAQGTLIEPTVLEASEVLAKHDEEYMPKEIAEKVGKHHQKPTYN
ncbi:MULTISPECIES: cytochrome c maturation protein CcmE [unclassified Thalassotalea]|uniref:cytochrome c maturation protein CcmE n=1 Tax=unclassified Thalassotalea TaxID=2614972 RepID=UPI00108064E8|nr:MULTISPECIES: cytochrome c maturation protein CcmE [unclassified Thalassotalea]NMP15842.1 cytochrome c maturation protein CcmE [Thalassotalea sp. Y01]QBY04886.1 cytochrome c maturation protein CcmE [Thalassotalea sp. HSM 43]